MPRRAVCTPRLVSGDHLTRDEFERRYEAMPEVKKAELVEGGQYVRQEVDTSGLYRSEVFPGLWLDPTALIRGDLATVLQRLQEGLASPEHAAFVARLQPSDEL